MRISVIPARGGSKRIQRKNIRPFAGKPMLHHAIEAARAAGLFDEIVVSTDDGEIAEAASAAGAAVPFTRPAELADDRTPTVPVIAHAVRACRSLGWEVEDVCCIYPTVPLLDPADLAGAFEAFVAGGRRRYVFPVAQFPSPIQRALRRLADGAVEPFHPESAATRTQDLEPAYFDAGQFYWGSAELWLAGREIHANARAILLPQWRAVDIDTEDDCRRAEALFVALRPRR